MDWQEINCIIDALRLLIARHRIVLSDPALDDDTRSDETNDLAYAEILLHKYEDQRDKMAAN